MNAKRVAAICVTAVIVVGAVAFGVCAYLGVAAPGGAAAKYGLMSYVEEDDVTDYIAVYRENMGYADSDDEAWATFLAEYNLTPERLRWSTIHQLIVDRETERRAAELGISVDDSEVDAQVQAMRDSMAFGDDEMWEQTLQMYGRTASDIRDMVRMNALKDKLCEREVARKESTDEDLVAYVQAKYPDGLQTKHVYRLAMQADEGEDALAALARAQQVREDLVAKGVDADVFAEFVQAYCTDEDLKGRAGADGWDLDMSDRSFTYQTTVENTGVGEVSSVFKEDDDTYSIIWIDDDYAIAGDADELDLDSLPSTLRSYFADMASYSMWSYDRDAYIESLYDASHPIVFPIPADVPYNVDMSLADVQLEEIEP